VCEQEISDGAAMARERSIERRKLVGAVKDHASAFIRRMQRQVNQIRDRRRIFDLHAATTSRYREVAEVLHPSVARHPYKIAERITDETLCSPLPAQTSVDE
jgi:hypothetical protein